MLDAALFELALLAVVVLLLVAVPFPSSACPAVELDDETAFDVSVLLVSLVDDASLAEDSLLESCELEETLGLAAELLVELVVTAAPSFVLVTLLATTFVALKANTIDTIANGVINGGVR